MADDLAQETFERAWQNRHSLPDVNRAVELKGWLRSIAKNMVLEYMKSRPKLQAMPLKEKEREIASAEIAEDYWKYRNPPHLDTRNIPQTIENTSILRISIEEEPLPAQNLSTTITAITDLYTRCWLIQQKRFSDLMDYAQTHDPCFVREANLQVGAMTHNSPAIIDLLLNAGTIAGGAATLVLALTKAFDAIAQTPLRYEAAKLKNEREILEQKIWEQEEQQKQGINSQKAQIELEKQQIELERQQLELLKDRAKFMVEIATMSINQLQTDVDSGQKEMLIHSLVPPLLQFTSTDATVTALSPISRNEENKGSTEPK